MGSTSAAVALGTEGFGAENLPYGSFEYEGNVYLGVRLGDHVLWLERLAGTIGDLSSEAKRALAHPNLDLLLAAGRAIWTEVRSWLQWIVQDERFTDIVSAVAFSLDKVSMHLAFTPADYVDYYASEHHAENIGKMFRPNEAALKPNWKHLPVGYHGRTGTLVVSGTKIIRPKGILPGDDGELVFAPSQRLDIEAEIGFVLGGDDSSGEVDQKTAASDHIFGAFLFNDWSARDIQNFEYVPLGPYLGKSFASTVGEWVVPFEALNNARVRPPQRDVQLVEYLQDECDEYGYFGINVTMEIDLNGETLSCPPVGLLYYTAPQMVAHMTVNGAGIRPGDMFASGTVSGPEVSQRGSFMEMSWAGKEPVVLSDNTEICFLRDEDTVTLRGAAPGPNGEIIRFGDCIGTIKPATTKS